MVLRDRLPQQHPPPHPSDPARLFRPARPSVPGGSRVPSTGMRVRGPALRRQPPVQPGTVGRTCQTHDVRGEKAEEEEAQKQTVVFGIQRGIYDFHKC